MVSFTMLQLKFALFGLVVLDTGDRFYSPCSVFRCKDFSREIKSPECNPYNLLFQHALYIYIFFLRHIYTG